MLGGRTRWTSPHSHVCTTPCMCLRTTVLVCVQAYLQVVVIEELLASLCRDSAEMSIEYVPVFVCAELLGSSVY